MKPLDYETLRDLSTVLFKNGQLLPVGWGVIERANVGDSFTAGEVRTQIHGHLESNQIRPLLDRLERVGCVRQLPYMGQPHARTWERVASPFWQFLVDWVRDRAGLVPDPVKRASD